MITEEIDQVENKANPGESIVYSVVVPISERQDDMHELYSQYAKELSADGHSYEFIFVLDGPHQETLQSLKELKKEYPEINIITLNRWFGEATALSVGFAKARGEIIITLSPYFQVEPCEVNNMLKKMSEGDNDLLISRRYPRIDSWFNRVQSWIFHKITTLLTGTAYHDISCGLRVMKRKVADEVPLYGDLHRFFPLLAFQRGFRILEVPVQQSRFDITPRVYRLGVYIRRLLDILTLFFLFKFTNKPLRFFGLIGLGLSGAGVVITGYLGFYRLLGFGSISDRPLLILGALLMVLGIQLFSIGLLGEIIIFTHSRGRKEYQVDEVLE